MFLVIFCKRRVIQYMINAKVRIKETARRERSSLALAIIGGRTGR